MKHAPAPLLERKRIFHSSDVEATRAFLRSVNFRFDPLGRDARRVDTRINGVYLPGMWLGYIQYGEAVAVRAMPARDDYWVQLPLRGHIEGSIGRKDVACDPSRAVVYSSERDNVLRYGADTTRLNLSLTAADLNRLLAALLGETPSAALRFAPALDLREGHGRSFARFVRLAAIELQSPDSLLWNATAMMEFSRFVMTALLLSHPHNYSARLQQPGRAPSPSDVRRAIDFIQANLGAPISLVDIVAQSGVPGRTLFKHFRDFRGASPMQYLRNARLDKAREALTGAQPGESVTRIAVSLGFAHLGRFSQEYRLRFGEKPSETMRRLRPRDTPRRGRG